MKPAGKGKSKGKSKLVVTFDAEKRAYVNFPYRIPHIHPLRIIVGITCWVSTSESKNEGALD